MKLALEQISRWSAAEIRSGSSGAPDSLAATGYSIDSRTLKPGDLFFAIRGERFDGHDFVAAALERGACAAVVARDRVPELMETQPERTRSSQPTMCSRRCSVLPPRFAATGASAWSGSPGPLARRRRKRLSRLCSAARFNVLKSQGNLNNGYGLPLQLLRLEPEHDVAVIEMGMSAAGEIAAFCRIAAPDWGVVTNVGHAHTEFFPDGIAGVARAKYELVESLPRHGVAFLNCDDGYVSQFGRDFEGKADVLRARSMRRSAC